MEEKKPAPQKKTFDPANPAYRFRLWVRRKTKDGVHVHVYWRRLFLSLLALTVAGWFALALAAMAFIRVNRGITEVHYVDLAFPWRWKNYRVSVGRHYLAAGRTLLTNGSIRGALTNLTSGLAMAPDDMESRKLLGVLQYRVGRPDLAAQTLVQGIPYLELKPDSLDQVFGLLREMQANDAIVAQTEKMLPATPDDQIVHLYLAMQLANARFGQGHYDECIATVQTWKLNRAPAGRVLVARSLWEEGQKKEAINRLQASLPQFKVRGELYVALVRFYRELGDHEQMRHYALLHYLENPAAPETRLDLIYAYSQTKAEEDLAKEVSRYLTDFASNQRALEMLANVAAIAGRPTITADLYAAAQAHRFPLAPFRGALIEAYLSNKEYKRALVEITTGRDDFKTAGANETAMLNGLEAIARFGSGDVAGADAALKNLLKDARQIRTSEALFLAKAMKAAGGTTEVDQLLELARDRDPKNEAAIVETVKADLDAKNHDGLVKHLPVFLGLPKPDLDLAHAALPLLNRPEDASLRLTIRHLAAAPTKAPATP